MLATVSTKDFLDGLKAVGESTRLRIVMLLIAGELNVKDLTKVLGQSQPRISRHLKLLVEAGLIERYREGSWVYFRLAEGPTALHIRHLLSTAVDPTDRALARDRERALAVHQERSAAAQRYFEAHAAEWDRIRALHVADLNVERAMQAAFGEHFSRQPAGLLVDLGTGTGRILELMAGRVQRAIGIDVNQAMLAYARAKLDALGLRHCQVRQGDLYNLPLPDAQADIVTLHQVLHFLDDPARAIREAARLLRPSGRLMIVDFAPHEMEFLREEFAHRRLGLDPEQVTQWVEQAGLHVLTHKDMPPATPANRRPKPDKLTVSLWLCGARIGAGAGPKSITGTTGSTDTMEVVA
jgi:ubiquinone/menaquinone biosynthesis C-methylase UbiE/DNA-binding transcriptional ArsR family regulator